MNASFEYIHPVVGMRPFLYNPKTDKSKDNYLNILNMCYFSLYVFWPDFDLDFDVDSWGVGLEWLCII